jgi:hypothetical protein
LHYRTADDFGTAIASRGRKNYARHDCCISAIVAFRSEKGDDAEGNMRTTTLRKGVMMSATSSQLIPLLRSGRVSQPARNPPANPSPRAAYRVFLQDAIAFISLATMAAVVTYLILMR